MDCSHYGKIGHLEENYYKIVGHPGHFKFDRPKVGQTGNLARPQKHAYVVQTQDSIAQPSSSVVGPLGQGHNPTEENLILDQVQQIIAYYSSFFWFTNTKYHS